MATDLNLIGYRFNWATSIFYIIYLMVEVPSNIILKRVGPRFYLPALVVGFGFISMCTAFVKDFKQLCIARAFLGIFEGGGKSGCISMLFFILTHLFPSNARICLVSVFILQAQRAVLPDRHIRFCSVNGRCFWRSPRNRTVTHSSLGCRINSHTHVAQHLLFRRSAHDVCREFCSMGHAFEPGNIQQTYRTRAIHRHGTPAP